MRRSPDPVSLVAGVAFSGAGLLLLLDHGNVHVQLRWVWPVLLVLLALALLPGVRGRHDPGCEPPSPPPPVSGAGGGPEAL
jgi:hypothetical protein